MRKRGQVNRASAPYLQDLSSETKAPGIDYAEAQERLGLDRDLLTMRARMTEYDATKLDTILEASMDRLAYRKHEQDWQREGAVLLECRAITQRLAKDGLSAEPHILYKEALTNIEKAELREIAVIQRETELFVDRHCELSLGDDQQQVRRLRRRQ